MINKFHGFSIPLTHVSKRQQDQLTEMLMLEWQVSPSWDESLITTTTFIDDSHHDLALSLPCGFAFLHDDDAIGHFCFEEGPHDARLIETLGFLTGCALPQPIVMVSYVLINTAMRGKGMGLALVAEMHRQARNHPDGFKCVLLTCRKDLISFYLRCGYVETSHLDSQTDPLDDAPLIYMYHLL